MNRDIIDIHKEKKESLTGDGFIITGVFGSFVRGEDTHESDLDLLFNVTEGFSERYPGLHYFKRLLDIKDELEQALCLRIDLSDAEALVFLHREYLLSGVMYV